MAFRRYMVALVALAVAVPLTLATGATAHAEQQFTTIGANTYVVPEGVQSLTIEALGGGGGGSINGAGGLGGGGCIVTATIAVTSSSAVTVAVGGGGAGKNATNGQAGGGGGSSYVQVDGAFQIIAGGGGGGGFNTESDGGQACVGGLAAGGAGGGAAAGAGGDGGNGGLGGSAGTVGGNGGSGFSGAGSAGAATGGGGGGSGTGAGGAGHSGGDRGADGGNGGGAGGAKWTGGKGGGGAGYGGGGGGGTSSAGGAGGSYSQAGVLAGTTYTPTRNGGTNGTNGSPGYVTVTPNYTVAFDANGGSGTMSNQTANAATALTVNSYTRSDYTFSGWNTSASGNGTTYANQASYPFTASTTLYAQWTLTSALSDSTVTFDANGGTGGAMSSQTANVATVLTVNSFTRFGYTFSGWNTSADGKGTAYANQASYAFTTSATLYAQWAPLASQAQTPANHCAVVPNGKLTGTEVLGKAGCVTASPASQPVAVTVLRVKSVGRGDGVNPKSYTLACRKSDGKTSKPVRLSYGSWCRTKQGALVIKIRESGRTLRVTWRAPATGTFAAYTKTRTYKT